MLHSGIHVELVANRILACRNAEGVFGVVVEHPRNAMLAQVPEPSVILGKIHFIEGGRAECFAICGTPTLLWLPHPGHRSAYVRIALACG